MAAPWPCPAARASATWRVVAAGKAVTPSAATGWSAAAISRVPGAPGRRPRPGARSAAAGPDGRRDPARRSASPSSPSEPGAASRRSSASRVPTRAAASAAAGPGSRSRGASGGATPGHRSVMTTSASGSRCDQPCRSRPGAGGRSSGQPRHSQPSVTTPVGQAEQAGQLGGIEQGDPADPEAMAAGGQPDVLDGAGAGPQVGVRDRWPGPAPRRAGRAGRSTPRCRPAPRGSRRAAGCAGAGRCRDRAGGPGPGGRGRPSRRRPPAGRGPGRR